MEINLNSATVTMPFAAFNGMREELRALQEQIAALQENHGSTSGEEINKTLAAAMNNAIKIVQFSVANHDPRTVRGWPWQALRAFGQLLKQTSDPSRVQLADTFLIFANECQEIDEYRIQRHEAARLFIGIAPADANDDHDDSPRTE